MDIGTSTGRFQQMVAICLRAQTAIVLLMMLPSSGSAQPQGRAFDLRTLQQAAVDTDPLMQQFSLLTTQTDLRLRNISALRLPSVTFESYGQYQSDVAHLPSDARAFA